MTKNKIDKIQLLKDMLNIQKKEETYKYWTKEEVEKCVESLQKSIEKLELRNKESR